MELLVSVETESGKGSLCIYSWNYARVKQIDDFDSTEFNWLFIYYDPDSLNWRQALYLLST